MKTYAKFIILTVAASMMFLAGCTEYIQQPTEGNIQPGSAGAQMASNRFTEPADNQLLALKEKKDLAEKFTSLTKDFEELQKQNEETIAVNEVLAEELEKTKTENDQTKKELKEANDLLVEMRIELNNWKKDILGFREEMRSADIAQLEALFKVLKILGADLSEASKETSS